MRKLRNAKVTIDGIDGVWNCLIDDDLNWNGFECPYFTKDTIRKYLDWNFNSGFELGENEWTMDNTTIKYDENENKFYEIIDDDEPIELGGYSFTEFGVDYYSFGGFNWTWCEVKEGEE